MPRQRYSWFMVSIACLIGYINMFSYSPSIDCLISGFFVVMSSFVRLIDWWILFTLFVIFLLLFCLIVRFTEYNKSTSSHLVRSGLFNRDLDKSADGKFGRGHPISGCCLLPGDVFLLCSPSGHAGKHFGFRPHILNEFVVTICRFLFVVSWILWTLNVWLGSSSTESGHGISALFVDPYDVPCQRRMASLWMSHSGCLCSGEGILLWKEFSKIGQRSLVN